MAVSRILQCVKLAALSSLIKPQWRNRFGRTGIIGLALLLLISLSSVLVIPRDAGAIPAFARKYNVNCSACHTAPPRLNPYGEQFLENGYQLPGTEDGGITKKKKLGDMTLGDVTNYMGFRLRGNALRNFSFKQENPPGVAQGVAENKTELAFPEVFSIFTAGTLTKNVGFFVELESNLEEDETGIERGFVTFNNLGYHNLAHVRVGRYDPSSLFSYSTHRQQIFPVLGNATGNGAFAAPTINRLALVPAAVGSKFYGLFQRDGTPIPPFAPSLFNSVSEVGAEIRGRPFGNWFLYQFGILNGSNEGFGDSNKGKDWYGMIRFDYAESNMFSANVSGFAYFGNSNAKVINQADVDSNRYGIAANLRYKMIDLYGAYTLDRIENVPVALQAFFDESASGLTLEADALVTNSTLLSLRYDHLDAGGVIALRKSQSFISVQVKQYLRTNVAVYVRNDFNVRDSEGGSSAVRNLRNAFFVGADIFF